MLHRLKEIFFFLSDTPRPKLNIPQFVTFFFLNLLFFPLLDFLESFDYLEPCDLEIGLFFQVFILVDITNVVNSLVILLKLFDFDCFVVDTNYLSLTLDGQEAKDVLASLFSFYPKLFNKIHSVQVLCLSDL